MESPLTSRAALLHALTFGPGHGAELKERVRVRTRGQLVLNDGTLYSSLRAMEAAGLVIVEEVARQGRDARYYRLTPSGEKAAEHGSAVVRSLYGSE